MKILPGKLAAEKNLGEFDADSYFSKLSSKHADGYVCVTTHSERGLEEGTLVFNNGKPVLCEYEYFWADVGFEAEDALKRTLNAAKSATGILSFYELSRNQVSLAEAFNKKAAVEPRPITLPDNHSHFFENELAATTAASAPTSLAASLGLTKFAHESISKLDLDQSAEKEQRFLKKIRALQRA